MRAWEISRVVYIFTCEHLSFECRLGPHQEVLEELKISTSSENLQLNLEGSPPIVLECQKQIKAYLKQRLKKFSLPVSPQGTDFQRRTWKALSQIPYGQVVSYKQIAELIDKPKAYQAIGQANGANPIPLIIPCHRVVSHKKGLGGYSLGLELKKYFLELEGVEF
jgi:methylated-DNA-[protein]-cysteine S-methyltransferase